MTTLLAACGAVQPIPSGPTPPPTALQGATPVSTNTASATLVTQEHPATVVIASPPQPKSGGTMRRGIAGDIVSIWPSFGGTGTIEVTMGVYDRLFTYDSKLQPVGQLVETWDQAPDGTRLKLSLRKGVQFHSGRELTSDDVRYMLQRATDPLTIGPATLVGLAKVWQVDTPDKYTVLLTSDQPRLGIFDLLTQLSIGDRNTLESADSKTRAVGTGPFSFVEWAPGDHILFSRNANYWQSGRPYLDSVQVTFTRDAQAMISQLEGGSIDYAAYAQTVDAVRLINDASYHVQAIYDAGTDYAIWMNVKMPPLDNKLVRQALGFAVDRDRFVQTTLHGMAGGGRSLPWATYSQAYDAEKNMHYGFDLDRARSLLASANVSAFSTTINYSTTGPIDDFAQLAQMYQADLARIGVSALIQPMDSATWADTSLKAAYAGLAIGMPSGFGFQDAASGLGSGAFGVANAFSGFTDETYKQLVGRAGSETDPDKRKRAYSDINDLILDQSFALTVSSFLQTSVWRANVHGIANTINGFSTLTDAWME